MILFENNYNTFGKHLLTKIISTFVIFFCKETHIKQKNKDKMKNELFQFFLLLKDAFSSMQNSLI